MLIILVFPQNGHTRVMIWNKIHKLFKENSDNSQTTKNKLTKNTITGLTGGVEDDDVITSCYAPEFPIKTGNYRFFA